MKVLTNVEVTTILLTIEMLKHNIDMTAEEKFNLLVDEIQLRLRKQHEKGGG